MALNSVNTSANNSRCSACLNESDNATYTPMDPTNRQIANTNNASQVPTQQDTNQPSTSTLNDSSCNQPSNYSQPVRSSNKLSFTSIGLNLKRAKSFNFKTKRSVTSTVNSNKKQSNQSGGSGSGGALGPIVSSLSLSPKWPLRFTCTTRKDKEKQEKEKQSQQQSEGCCRCVCYRPFNSGNNGESQLSGNATANSQRDVDDRKNVSSTFNQNPTPFSSTMASTSAADQPLSSNSSLPTPSEQKQSSPTGSSASTPIGGATTTCRLEKNTQQVQQVVSYNSANISESASVASVASISSSSVVQLVSNAIVLLEEERERNRTMAAVAMAAMNGVVTTGAGIGGIYGSTNGANMGDVWEPLFHIPSIGPQQQSQHSSHEDCDESARRQRAREIEQGVDPPANYRTLSTTNVQSCATRRVQLLCDSNGNSSDQDNACASRRLQIVCPSDLPVDSLRALFQDHVTLRSCPLDSSWTGCHTQVDFVHCLVPDLLSISRCTFYWGKMDRYEAERLLDGKPEGTFLLRDSAQEEFLFSVSFRKYGRSLHARIEQWNHKFSFDSHDPGVYTSDTVCGLIEHYKDPSSCMFFEPVLTWPLHRNFTFTLQHLARAVITSRLHYDDVNQLQLPKALKVYLKEYHYRQKVRVERFDDCGPTNGAGDSNVQWLVNASTSSNSGGVN